MSDYYNLCLKQLKYIMDLKKGWLDGEGEKITEDAYKKAWCFLFWAKDLAEYFRIYPTPEGGISFEMFIPDKKRHIFVEISYAGTIDFIIPNDIIVNKLVQAIIDVHTSTHEIEE